MNNKAAIEKIWDGEFDWSRRSKVMTAPIIALMGYLSWESCKVYSTLGGSGTKYLPIGNFTEQQGADAAFWSNAVLNFWFLTNTMFVVRTAYCHHQLRKKLDIPTRSAYKATKFLIALIFSVLSGTVMALIAGHSQGLYNQVITGIVNTFLNLLGAIELINFLEKSIGWIKDTILGKCLNSEYQQLPQTNKLTLNLNNILDAATIPANSDDYIEFLSQPDETTPIISPSGSKPNNTVLFVGLLLHTIMQICDKIANYGYWQDTIKDTAELFSPHRNTTNTTTTAGDQATGTLFFLPFSALSIWVMVNTTRNFIDLAKTARHKIANFKSRPNCSKSTAIQAIFFLIETALTTYCYFLSYLSANSALELNAENGWNEWWNTYPTVIGALSFNGFGFLSVIMTSHQWGIERCLHTKIERNASNKHRLCQDFLSITPKEISTPANGSVQHESSFQ
jgi:hypothetical protein